MDYNRKVTLTALVLILAVILISTTTFLVTNPVLTADLSAYTKQAETIFNQAKTEVEQIRNTTLPNVTLTVITKQGAIDKWGKPSADADLTNIMRQENVYKGLFMMAKDESLYQATVDWTANWGAATVGKTDIYVIKENFDPWDMPNAEATFVHEFTHIWEPQLSDPTTFDMDKAHSALVEGDASFMGDYFKDQYNAKAEPAALKIDDVPIYLIDNLFLDELHPIPSTISNLNWFPYTQGKTFINSLYEKGGFQTLNQAYVSGYTPDTTEQILHPDKYFANETAKQILAPTAIPGNWTKIQNNRGQFTDRYGEYFIQDMLSNWLKENNSQEATNAAAGWGGDNFTYYERSSNDFLFTWNIKWDSAYDASEFYQAFIHMMSLTDASQQSTLNWFSNGKYLTISLNQTQNSTLIVCSTDPTVQLSNFE
jgi:hypothetical protein